MSSLKAAVKKVLVRRQHKRYQKEVEAGNLTYDKWIRQQENGLEIAPLILCRSYKSLTNDFEKEGFGRSKNQNEGNDAENDRICQLMKYDGEEDRESNQASILWADAETFGRNYTEILKNEASEIILLSFYQGQIGDIAPALIRNKMNENKNIILIYGDEDSWKGEGSERYHPWFKPDWSPDAFLSGFYFGGLAAVRTESLKKICAGKKEEGRAVSQETGKEITYRLLYELIRANHGFSTGHDPEKGPVYHIGQVLFHSMVDGYEEIRKLRLPQEELLDTGKRLPNTVKDLQRLPEISIIIPSKDNPAVLFRCIDSLLACTKTEYPYTILVVDNGSREENRLEIERRVEEKNKQTPGKLQYLYEPMTFNFSRMCNLGAETVKGELLLFLNDDMEIIQQDWLTLLAEKAVKSYVGAVGAKLLYPGTDIIQHAGITNLRVGPAHKLQYLKDSEEYYFGRNRGVHNMLAVTGACLMVKRSVFEQAGGFAEDLAVAFNDVDLCYTIYRLGYYNVQRNDVTLYHHESLSRGKDGESAQKQLRLQKEKDLLYERHQEIYGKDPFYHERLTTDMLESDYSPAFHYQVKMDMPWSEVYPCSGQVKRAREDSCLVVGMECALDLYQWQYGVSPEKGRMKVKPEEMGYYFQGYSFVIGADNACYKKKLLLKNQGTGEVLAISIENCCRQDIKRNLKDQLNVDLTGYAAKLQKNKLKPGIYQFGMLAEDACSRQKLVNWSNWVLEVK